MLRNLDSLCNICFVFQSIPQFLPVMRGTLSLPAHRDPEVLERLQPIHLKNMCNRMEVHLNASAAKVAGDQAQITTKIKEVRRLSYWQMAVILYSLMTLVENHYLAQIKREVFF